MQQADQRPTSAQEPAHIELRRRQAGLSAPEQLAAPPSALALSGGGIRSATFCLGLVRGLAGNDVLRHFDYLSTVSGGGYLGSALTRLYCDERRGRAVQDGVAREDSVWLWWLRSNGRYLTPAGLRDLGQAFASILRGVLSTHFEVGMLLLVGAGGLLLPYLVLLWARAAGAPAWAGALREQGVSFWWLALAVPVAVAFHQIFAYWFWRSSRARGSALVDAAVAVVGVVVGLRWGAQAFAALQSAQFPQLADWLSALTCVLLFTPATAQVVRRLEAGQTVTRARLQHTKALALALWGILLLGALGALDLGTWWLARRITQAAPAAIGLPSVAAIIAVIRLLITKAGDLKKWVDAGSRFVNRARLLNVAGLLLLAAVVVVWTTAFQWFADAQVRPWAWLHDLLGAPSATALHAAQWLVLCAGPLAYAVLTSANLELLNLSSLHNFYRARIERAYVATGNDRRFADGILKSRREVDTGRPEMRLTDAIDADDVELVNHRPHLYGGPIHLVNCCINQTIDDRTDNYNADRKGVYLTVSALGAETGTRFAYPDGLPVPGTLSMWAAISGAAASSGMGSQTSPGSAALMFLSGLRLGYWHAAVNRRQGEPERWTNRPRLVMSEAFARFPGLRSAEWYLSDGGHFDNTGVYALLKRQARLIVVADCGADPGYAFEDLENLVRKAAIDYCCDIEFIAGCPTLPPALQAAIGRPADFKPGEGAQCLLLGRVTYHDGSKATLVVAKPRVVPGLPLDLEAYAARNEAFPQQGTGDQFFDEAQWESYQQLGLHIGALLTRANLNALHDCVDPESPQPMVDVPSTLDAAAQAVATA